MTLSDRYLKGKTQEVYEEIYALGENAFDPEVFPEVDKVLKATFHRAAFNIATIYKGLLDIDYQFLSSQPITAPDPETEILLQLLKQKSQESGHIPLSLEYFYRIAGSCDFVWDWKNKPDIPWVGADPLQMPTLKELLDMTGNVIGNDHLLLSADDLQKDNISGDCYRIEVTSSPSVDSIIRHWDIPFIEYLRIAFNNCGFAMADRCDYQDLQEFCERVRPMLIPL